MNEFFEANLDDLQERLSALHALPGLPALLAPLAAHVNHLQEVLLDGVCSRFAALRKLQDQKIRSNLQAHVARHAVEITSLLDGGPVEDLDFVRRHAGWYVEEQLPLEVPLHAYSHGLKLFTRQLRGVAAADARQAELLAALTDFGIEYQAAASMVLAREYVAHTRLQADVAGDQRAQLLSVLLDGYDETDPWAAKLVRESGYLDRRLSYCVALARPVDPVEMQNPARARRLVETIDALCEQQAFRRLIDIRQNSVAIIFSAADRVSGWTAPGEALPKRAATQLMLLGNSVLVGLSSQRTAVSELPGACQEARWALDLANVAHRVVQFSEIPVRRLVMHLAGSDLQPRLPAWSTELMHADARLQGALIASLRAYADAAMNAMNTAKLLAVHPNTVYARFERIRAITGLEPRSYHDLTDLLIAAECWHSAPREVRGV